MAFLRVRKNRYLYREERVREGKRVRSISTYLGVVGGNPASFADNRSLHGHSSEVADMMQSAARHTDKDDEEREETSKHEEVESNPHKSDEANTSANTGEQDSGAKGEQDGEAEGDDGDVA